MSRKIYITIPVIVIIRIDEGASMSQLQDDLGVVVSIEGKSSSQAFIEDSSAGPFEITYSK